MEAIPDYTEAIGVSGGRFVQAYGARGFVYGEKGDYDRSVLTA